MRALGLGLALVIGALGACKGESLVSERRDAGGTPPVDASAGLVFPDAATGPLFPPDASTGPVYSAACWASLLPPETQPIAPASSVADACAAGAAATATDWTYPQNPAGTEGDDRRYIVGRWAVCAVSIYGLPAHDGIEFGANGRWRMLGIDTATGALVPLPRTGSTSGYYYLLGIGQLNLASELPAGGGQIFDVTFTAGMGAINFNNPQGLAEIYARTTPSPLNGADNPPPTAAGACSMEGDWDVPANNGPVGAPASVFSFDAAGNFVAGPPSANLCDGFEAHGTYALSPGMFQLTSNIGLGACPWSDTAGFPAAFDASCNHLSLTRQYDNCTGARGYFNEPTTLTRRSAAPGDAGTLTSFAAPAP
jgi:hypothetical protein